MKNNILKSILCLSLLSSSAFASELVFICHRGMDYNKHQIYMAFRGQADEAHVVDNASLTKEILSFVGMDDAKYRKTWTKTFFRRAINLPPQKKSDADVVEYVSSHPEGIGYVSSAPSGHDEIVVCGK